MPSQKIELLLIEDNPADVRLTEILLDDAAPSTFSVTQVEHLNEALQLLAGPSRFHAILLDLSLPDAQGLPVLLEILSAAPATPVIVLSGYDDEEICLQAVQAGAQDYLIKGQSDGHLLVRAIRYAIERKQAQEQMRYLATHDTLTGLPNRLLLSDRLAQSISQARHDGSGIAVFHLGLDRFKAVNDTLGHAAGDLLIGLVARRLQSRLREIDTVARVGSDEFIVVMTAIHQTEDAARMAQGILEGFCDPFSIGPAQTFSTASIGITLYPADGETPARLLENASTAMNRAKASGRNNYQYYSVAMHSHAFQQTEMINGLRQALARGEMQVHYQFVTDIVCQRVGGVEALIRWQRNGVPFSSPDEFIPLAEETGLIVPIGEWVLRTACAQSRAWRDAGLAPMRVAVNLSPVQIQQKDVVQMIQDVLIESGLPPDGLEIEITEGAIMKDLEATVLKLQSLRDMGVSISIDDFGTGYSSLKYLQRFPVHTLKIDKSFVQNLAADTNSAAIVRTIITLADNLALRVVAEGVETLDQLQQLRSMGCSHIQGYLLCRPMPAGKITDLLAGSWQADLVTALEAPLP